MAPRATNNGNPLRHTPRPRTPPDPLTAALQPPPDESPEARESRLRAEDEAKKRSENIDRMLKHDARRNQKRKTVKVLLLGQSESGKSTTLKRLHLSSYPEFQLLHTPAAFHKERIAWRFVIYLNLVRSIRRILEAIAPEDNAGLDDDDDTESIEPAAIIISSSGSSDRPSSAHSRSQPNYEAYRRRLAPLMELEQRLITVLSDPEEEGEREATHLPDTSAWQDSMRGSPYSPASPSPLASASSHAQQRSDGGPTHGHGGHGHGHGHGGRPPRITIPHATSPSWSGSSYSSSGASGSGSGSAHPTSPRSPTSPALSVVSSVHEPVVRHGYDWKRPFALGRIQSPKTPHSGEMQGWWEDPSDPVHTLNRCAPVMTELWRDPKVRAKLSEKNLRLEESSGFYLEEIERITAKMYFPTDDDVLRARLKTTGVVEHKFTLSKNSEFRGVEWIIYDVGGARNQRQAWAPYFDDVNAIIFLAPISAFDQQLVEDPSVNRLQDSFQLWKQVVENRLLQHVNIVLFLNKCDLLEQKLNSGVRLSHYMPSYNRPNDYNTVSQYFRGRFVAMHQQLSPDKSRELVTHLTSVTDTRKTHTIISSVRDFILTANLKSSSLM